MQSYFNFLPTSDLGIVVLILSINVLFMAFCGYLLRDLRITCTKIM